MIRCLGSGSFCTAYLVRHKSLEQERTLKIYPKGPHTSVSNLTEAKVLKTLHHPGIPIIYDLEEDHDYFYVVEEYIQGEPLDRLLLRQPTVSMEFYYNLCLQLCDIFAYLHSLSPSPVIYRDLKPEHMLLCGSSIKLIDFNIAVSSSPGNNLDHFGNAEFSAPELFSQDEIDPSSDIYSLGCMMDYLSSHLEKRPSRTLRTIIFTARQQNPDLRYETVEALAAAIREDQKKKGPTHPEQIIAVIGSRSGCGTTHLAVSLTSVLNYSGHSAVYYEKNFSDSLRNAAEYLENMTEQAGVCYYRFFQGIPRYGTGIVMKAPVSAYRILDYGNLSSEELHLLLSKQNSPEEIPDLVLLIGTGASWCTSSIKVKNDILLSEEIPCKIIGNLCSHGQSANLAHCLGRPVYQYPVDYDPFLITPKKKRFFFRLLDL